MTAGAAFTLLAMAAFLIVAGPFLTPPVFGLTALAGLVLFALSRR